MMGFFWELFAPRLRKSFNILFFKRKEIYASKNNKALRHHCEDKRICLYKASDFGLLCITCQTSSERIVDLKIEPWAHATEEVSTLGVVRGICSGERRILFPTAGSWISALIAPNTTLMFNNLMDGLTGLKRICSTQVIVYYHEKTQVMPEKRKCT